MGIMSMLTGGSKSSTASGFTTNPQEVKDYMLELLFPQMKAIQAGGYQGIPLRRIDETDTDPNFGSTARQGLQRYKDRLAAMQAQNASSPTASAAPPIETETDPVYGKTYIKGAPRGGNKWNAIPSFEDAATMSQQGISAPQGNLVMEMLKRMQKGAA